MQSRDGRPPVRRFSRTAGAVRFLLIKSADARGVSLLPGPRERGYGLMHFLLLCCRGNARNRHQRRSNEYFHGGPPCLRRILMRRVSRLLFTILDFECQDLFLPFGLSVRRVRIGPIPTVAKDVCEGSSPRTHRELPCAKWHRIRN